MGLRPRGRPFRQDGARRASTKAAASVASSPDVPRLHRDHAVDHVVGCAQERGLERVLRGGTIAESVAERHRRGGRLHERRVVLRHRGHHRVSGLRRLHVFRRLARRVPHGALDRRRAVAQRGQVHDGRRARVSLEPAAGARDGRALDADREHVLHDRADGRRRRARVAAAARHGHYVSDGGRRHRRADDRVRGVRRNARDHLGADRQSHLADGRHDSAQHSRAAPTSASASARSSTRSAKSPTRTPRATQSPKTS